MAYQEHWIEPQPGSPDARSSAYSSATSTQQLTTQKLNNDFAASSVSNQFNFQVKVAEKIEGEDRFNFGESSGASSSDITPK